MKNNNLKKGKLLIEVKKTNHQLKEITYYSDIIEFYYDENIPFELTADAQIEEYIQNKSNETGCEYEIISRKKI